jgi:hypothetical protein
MPECSQPRNIEICSQCQKENPKDLTFCAWCGAPLVELPASVTLKQFHADREAQGELEVLRKKNENVPLFLVHGLNIILDLKNLLLFLGELSQIKWYYGHSIAFAEIIPDNGVRTTDKIHLEKPFDSVPRLLLCKTISCAILPRILHRKQN